METTAHAALCRDASPMVDAQRRSASGPNHHGGALRHGRTATSHPGVRRRGPDRSRCGGDSGLPRRRPAARARGDERSADPPGASNRPGVRCGPRPRRHERRTQGVHPARRARRDRAPRPEGGAALAPCHGWPACRTRGGAGLERFSGRRGARSAMGRHRPPAPTGSYPTDRAVGGQRPRDPAPPRIPRAAGR